MQKFENTAKYADYLTKLALEEDRHNLNHIMYDVFKFYKTSGLPYPKDLSLCGDYDCKRDPNADSTIIIQEIITFPQLNYSYSYYSVTRLEYALEQLSDEKNRIVKETVYSILCPKHFAKCSKCDEVADTSQTIYFVDPKPLCKYHQNQQLIVELEDGTSPELKKENMRYHTERDPVKWKNTTLQIARLVDKVLKLANKRTKPTQYVKLSEI